MSILTLDQFATMTNNQIDLVVRKTVIGLLSSVVKKSPVGNPELWKVNRIGAQYNQAVRDYNFSLRQDPLNLNRAGRLRPGLRSHDRMDLHAPEGYVGGRFRGNWQVGVNSDVTTEIDRIDKNGSSTVSVEAAKIPTQAAGKVYYIANNLPYAQALETGHSTQAPQGVVGVTVLEFESIVRSNLPT